jgi:hypothetical protein
MFNPFKFCRTIIMSVRLFFLTIFVSGLSPSHFRFEYAVRYIRIWICNWSLSYPFLIWAKHMVREKSELNCLHKSRKRFLLFSIFFLLLLLLYRYKIISLYIVLKCVLFYENSSTFFYWTWPSVFPLTLTHIPIGHHVFFFWNVLVSPRHVRVEFDTHILIQLDRSAFFFDTTARRELYWCRRSNSFA